MKHTFSILCAVAFVSACDAPGATKPNVTVSSGSSFSVVAPNAPSGPVVDQFARDFLNSIQANSIADRAEYCGYIFTNAQGQLQATLPRRGTFASCDMPAPEPGRGIIASYHTHGAYDPDYDNEVPSTLDLQSDFQFGMDGYVSTPGGRVWLVDVQTRSTRQICGRGCVISDPGYNPAADRGILPVYTIPSLQARQGA